MQDSELRAGDNRSDNRSREAGKRARGTHPWIDRPSRSLCRERAEARHGAAWRLIVSRRSRGDWGTAFGATLVESGPASDTGNARTVPTPVPTSERREPARRSRLSAFSPDRVG